MIQQAIEKIEAQQGTERTPVWIVGEQLKDICRNEPKSAELIAQDLDNPELSLANAEKKIKAYADAHKTGNFACVTPAEAESILRKFYGLPIREEDGNAAENGKSGVMLDLSSFF